jgi:hypothetical protein
MRRVTRIALVTLIIISSVSVVYAEFLVKSYIEMKNGEPMIVYIKGLGKGSVYANVIMKSITGNSLFCTPNKLVLDISNFFRVLNDEIERKKASIGLEKPQETMI